MFHNSILYRNEYKTENKIIAEQIQINTKRGRIFRTVNTGTFTNSIVSIIIYEGSYCQDLDEEWDYRPRYFHGGRLLPTMVGRRGEALVIVGKQRSVVYVISRTIAT